jgi:hypothetical protein
MRSIPTTTQPQTEPSPPGRPLTERLEGLDLTELRPVASESSAKDFDNSFDNSFDNIGY